MLSSRIYPIITINHKEEELYGKLGTPKWSMNPKMVNDDNWWVDFVTVFMVNNILLLLALVAYALNIDIP